MFGYFTIHMSQPAQYTMPVEAAAAAWYATPVSLMSQTMILTDAAHSHRLGAILVLRRFTWRSTRRLVLQCLRYFITREVTDYIDQLICNCNVLSVLSKPEFEHPAPLSTTATQRNFCDRVRIIGTAPSVPRS